MSLYERVAREGLTAAERDDVLRGELRDYRDGLQQLTADWQFKPAWAKVTDVDTDLLVYEAIWSAFAKTGVVDGTPSLVYADQHFAVLNDEQRAAARARCLAHHASLAPLSLAWEAFGPKNGNASLAEMGATIVALRRDAAPLGPREDPVIGCRILTEPFFWPRDLWIPVPDSFSRNIVVGKGYATDTEEGLRLWGAVCERLTATPAAPRPASGDRFGAPMLLRQRLGQSAFRLAVTDGYGRRCAVSSEKTLPILDAAHIRAYGDGGEHELANGLLLRTDIHRLFDLGYVTVSERSTFAVSERLKADFDNGVHYYAMQGNELAAPRRGFAPPAPEALRWHRENRYLG